VLLFSTLAGSFIFWGEFGAFPQLDLLSFDCGYSTGSPCSSSLPSLYGGVIFVRNRPGMLFSTDPSDSCPSSTSSLTLSSTFPSDSILIEDGSKSRIRGSMSSLSTMTLDFPCSLEVDGIELTPEMDLFFALDCLPPSSNAGTAAFSQFRRWWLNSPIE
jgi:hypothetical protein